MNSTTTSTSVMCPASAAASLPRYQARPASDAFSIVAVGGHRAGGRTIETGRARTELPGTNGVNATKRRLHLIGSRSG
jgi:hypothetical protein